MKVCAVPDCDKAAKHIGYCVAHYKRLRKYGDPMAGGTLKGAPRAFLDAALARETDDCIEWPFARQDGYGVINADGSAMLASRAVCIAAHGAPPPGRMEAAHSCGNRPCINKRHIRWATCAENSADKVEHGTLLRGEAVASSRFTDCDIRDIRKRSAAGEPQNEIARQYGVHSSHIRRITSREIWAHVDDQSNQERTAA